MPDPHDAAEPEVLPAVRPGTDKLLPRFLIVSNLQVGRSAAHRRRQRARAARAAGRRAVLLRPGPQGAAGSARAAARARSSTTTSSARSSSASSACSASPGSIARAAAASMPPPAERAAWLAKADLLTGMVGEFPELQGIMGRYYALHDGEPRAVADAIEAHYRPRFAGDALPEITVACARRARRQARDARRPLRHRPAADRRQGSVRPAPRRRSA